MAWIETAFLCESSCDRSLSFLALAQNDRVRTRLHGFRQRLAVLAPKSKHWDLETILATESSEETRPEGGGQRTAFPGGSFMTSKGPY